MALTAQAAPGTISVHYSAPCAPYAPVSVTYGPVTFGEETGVDGQLDLTLPALSGVTTVRVQTGSAAHDLTLPPVADAQRFVALVLPGDDAGAELSADATQGQKFGFPGRAPQAWLLPVSAGALPVLSLPITGSTCGRRVALDLVDGRKGPRQQLEVTMPACSREGEVLHLPLVPAGG